MLAAAMTSSEEGFAGTMTRAATMSASPSPFESRTIPRTRLKTSPSPENRGASAAVDHSKPAAAVNASMTMNTLTTAGFLFISIFLTPTPAWQNMDREARRSLPAEMILKTDAVASGLLGKIEILVRPVDQRFGRIVFPNLGGADRNRDFHETH